MLVGRSQFDKVLGVLHQHSQLYVDTETTGLRPFHGDRLFSIIINVLEAGEYTSCYFNFWPYPDASTEQVLSPSHLAALRPLFADPTKLWGAHNAPFDLAMLGQEGIEIGGKVHCTQAAARLLENDLLPSEYGLDACARRIGYAKDDRVEQYIEEHGLWEWVDPTNHNRGKNKFYYKVPLDIIVPYGERDAEVGHRVLDHQKTALQALAHEAPTGLPTVLNVLESERRLTHTLVRMERVGLQVDRDYCLRAARYELDRAQGAVAGFKKATGRDFKASPKLFAEVFADERSRWGFTEKGNPSFESDILQRFEHPAAKLILDYRDAKSKSDFYGGFLYFSDKHGIVHPHFVPWGTATGRFSSNNPNFQNLTSEEDEETLAQEFVVRRAIVPRPGYIFIMPDYDQMEYRMMFDYACFLVGHQTELVRQIKDEGKDPHQATADLVTAMGTPLNRKKAKNGNFAILYGAGYETLAYTIKSTVSEARILKHSIFKAAPEIKTLVDGVHDAACMKGRIWNWAGRRSRFPNHNFAYKAPNYLIQGGCADVVKIAMNRIDEMLLGFKSRMIGTIHDELPIEVHESEVHIVPKLVKEIMESVYPYSYLPLTAGMEWSNKSLADKVKGFPA